MGNIDNSIVLKISSDEMGSGDSLLGKKLIAAFFNVLAESDIIPGTFVCFNNGVKLFCEESPIAEIAKEFAESGVKILCCGTCLNYFELNDKLIAGQESNMVEISASMLKADKVISPN